MLNPRISHPSLELHYGQRSNPLDVSSPLQEIDYRSRACEEGKDRYKMSEDHLMPGE